MAGKPPSVIAQARRLALLKRNLRLEGRRQSLAGERLRPRERDRLGGELRTLPPRRLHARTLGLGRAVRALRRKSERRRHVGAPDIQVPAALDAIARCESGGDPHAVSADGDYRGKYQFDHGTWASVGGSGDPAAAPEREQDRRAALLYGRSGVTPWPVCGQL